MKIGIDARFWNETGVGRYIRNLVHELQLIDSTNDYVLFIRKSDLSEVKSHIYNENFEIKVADIHWHSLKEQLTLPQIFAKEKVDLMHFPYFSLPIFYKGKFVVTIHDLILHHFSTGDATTLPLPLYKLKHIGYQTIMSQAAKKASKIIAVSEATKEEIVDHLKIPEKKIVVTYEGVDEALSGEGGKLPDNTYFLHVGNVYPHKNAERLVQAFGQNFLGKNVDLIFVGKDDHFMKKLKAYVNAAGLNPQVIFKHNVSDKELATLYKGAAAVVVPSLMEGFGLPVLEAMANNCVVIASNIPSLKEVGKDALIYINPGDTNDIAEKLQYVINSDKDTFKELLKNGKKLSGKYSWKSMAKETLAVYESSVSIRQS